MKTKIPPFVAALILLVATGAVALVVWTNIERRPPHLPTGMAAAMGEQTAKQKKPGSGAVPPSIASGKHPGEKESKK